MSISKKYVEQLKGNYERFDLDEYPDPREYYDPAESMDDFAVGKIMESLPDPEEELELNLDDDFPVWD